MSSSSFRECIPAYKQFQLATGQLAKTPASGYYFSRILHNTISKYQLRLTRENPDKNRFGMKPTETQKANVLIRMSNVFAVRKSVESFVEKSGDANAKGRQSEQVVAVLTFIRISGRRTFKRFSPKGETTRSCLKMVRQNVVILGR